MQAERNARRPRGTGSLFIRTDRAGRRTWYGKVRVGERQVKRRLGPRARAGIGGRADEAPGRGRASPADRRGVRGRRGRATARSRLRGRALPRPRRAGPAAQARRRSTTTARSPASTWSRSSPAARSRRIDVMLVEAYIGGEAARGAGAEDGAQSPGPAPRDLSPRAASRLVRGKPGGGGRPPAGDGADPDIRFLEREELEALIAAVPDDELGRMERVLYLTAAMTGLRQGELVALRWRDVDWTAGVVRVRRSYTRGEFGTPKSRRSVRAVPLADRLAGELERHYRALAVPGRRRPRLRPPGDRAVPTTPRGCGSASRARWQRAGVRRGPLPRPAPHLRHPDGGRRRAAARDPGVDGPPRLQDHQHLRRLRARSIQRPAMGSSCVRYRIRRRRPTMMHQSRKGVRAEKEEPSRTIERSSRFLSWADLNTRPSPGPAGRSRKPLWAFSRPLRVRIPPPPSEAQNAPQSGTLGPNSQATQGASARGGVLSVVAARWTEALRTRRDVVEEDRYDEASMSRAKQGSNAPW